MGGGDAARTVAAFGKGGVKILGGGVMTFVADGVVVGGLVTQQPPHRHGHMTAGGGDGGGDGFGSSANDDAGGVVSFFSSIVWDVVRSRLYHTPPTQSNTIKPQNVMSKPYSAFTLERVTSSFLYAWCFPFQRSSEYCLSEGEVVVRTAVGEWVGDEVIRHASAMAI